MSAKLYYVSSWTFQKKKSQVIGIQSMLVLSKTNECKSMATFYVGCFLERELKS